jgi:Fe-S oxidoreductase
VSIPDLRTTFLNDYHKHYKKRKLRDYLLGHIEGILPTAYKLRGLWKLANRTGIAKKLGIINSPEPANLSFEDIARKHSLKYYTDANQSTKLEPNAVIIFTDSFTGTIDTQILLSSVEFIKKAGYIPYLTEPQTSGKALIVAGYIDKFKANAERLAKLFNPLFALNIPIVSLENTIALMFRDEVRKFATSFAGKVLTLAELAELLTKDKVIEAMADAGKYRLLPHCTEQALAPAEAILWQKAYAKVGINLEVKNLGCCGMAGTYGHLAENANNSSGLFELNWKKTVTDDNVTTLASGFSCRCQADKLAAIKLKHPIEVLNNLIGDFKG